MTIWRRLHTGVRRLHRDEGGQGVMFAAASMVVLVAFVSLAFNVGAAVGQRTRMQMAADAMAYSGAVVEANALSTIAWINSGMAQIYYKIMRYSADLTATAVAAELERQSLMESVSGIPEDEVDWASLTWQWQSTQAYQDYLLAKTMFQPEPSVEPTTLTEATGNPYFTARLLMRDLSLIQNALAVVAPNLIWDKMYEVGEANGAERIAIFPYQRMFPHDAGESHWLIERIEDGWRLTNLDADNGETITLQLLSGPVWVIQWSRGDLSTYEWRIQPESSFGDSEQWLITYEG